MGDLVSLLAGTSETSGNNMWWLWPVLGVVLIAYIFMASSSRRKQTKRMDEIKQKLTLGAKVITFAGTMGTLVELNEKDNSMTLELKPDGIRVTYLLGALYTIVEDKNTTILDGDNSGNSDGDSIVNYDD